jgi:hypothetical protein
MDLFDIDYFFCHFRLTHHTMMAVVRLPSSLLMTPINHSTRRTRMRLHRRAGDCTAHVVVQRSIRRVVFGVGVMMMITTTCLSFVDGFVADRKRSASCLEKMQKNRHHPHHHGYYYSKYYPFISASSSSTATLAAATKRQRYRSYKEDGDASHDSPGASSRQREASTERPTQTLTQRPDPEIMPSKPKIVVLGASGKIGTYCRGGVLFQEARIYSSQFLAAAANRYVRSMLLCFFLHFHTTITRTSGGSSVARIQSRCHHCGFCSRLR